MADVTIVEAFPNFYDARLYMEALEEASNYIKEHKNDAVFPKDGILEITKKALGPIPTYDDSTNPHNMSITKIAFMQYNKDKYLFLKRALVLSR